MKVKTSELTGQALDWAVAKAEGFSVGLDPITVVCVDSQGVWEPSCDWAQGGPIIDREKLIIGPADAAGKFYFAEYPDERAKATGTTYLIAAMRCYVTLNLGEEVEVPDQLVGG